MTGAGIRAYFSGRRRAFRVIMTVNALLLLLLAVLWLLLPGMGSWSPPPANTASFSDAGTILPRMAPVTPEALRETVERPLFSEGRQPPDASNAEGEGEGAEESPVANIRLLGFFSGSDIGGIIADVDGEVKRVALGQSFGQWTVQRIDTDARQVVLRSGAEEQVLGLPLSSAEDMAKAGAGAKPPPANNARPPSAAARRPPANAGRLNANRAPANTRPPTASVRQNIANTQQQPAAPREPRKPPTPAFGGGGGSDD